MAKVGVGLNFIGMFIVTTITYLIAIPAFGVVLGTLPNWVR
jgi:hypothetical protein